MTTRWKSAITLSAAQQTDELRHRVADLERLLGRTRFSTRGAFEDCILIWDTTAKAFRPAASSSSIQEIVVNSTDHGDLSGLAGDDHPQYAQIAATETITEAWTFDRGAGAPFVVQAGSAMVTDLIADIKEAAVEPGSPLGGMIWIDTS